jgi:hypothetical protein
MDIIPVSYLKKWFMPKSPTPIGEKKEGRGSHGSPGFWSFRIFAARVPKMVCVHSYA